MCKLFKNCVKLRVVLWTFSRERLTKTCTDRWEGEFTSLHKIINETTKFSITGQYCEFHGKVLASSSGKSTRKFLSYFTTCNKNKLSLKSVIDVAVKLICELNTIFYTCFKILRRGVYEERSLNSFPRGAWRQKRKKLKQRKTAGHNNNSRNVTKRERKLIWDVDWNAHLKTKGGEATRRVRRRTNRR